MDLASMALARDRNAQPAQTTMRQLNFDSSPKGGLEVLGIREFVIRGQEIDKAQDRMLPIQAMGFGLMSAVDKATALLHSIYLESGPTSHSMRNYCASVNITLTDAGVEQYVPQLPDCIDEFLSHELHDLDFKGCSSLWPNAMRVLDWGHLWHWLSQTVLQSLSFFSECSDILFRYRETPQEYAKIHTLWGLWRRTQASKIWEIRMHFL